MNNSIEKNIQRIQRLGLSCSIKNGDNVRYFHNGHEYVEIGGIKWATCNVGAENPSDSGLYFAWGETSGFTAEQVKNGGKRFKWNFYKYGTYGYLSKYNGCDKKINLEPKDDAATFNMGVGWRTPTREEFKAIVDSTTSKWVTNYKGSGVNGRLFTDKKDKSKELFFPAAGHCNYDSVYFVGDEGYYWSSSLDTSGLEDAFNLLFNNVGTYWGHDESRHNGFAIRGVVAE